MFYIVLMRNEDRKVVRYLQKKAIVLTPTDPLYEWGDGSRPEKFFTRKEARALLGSGQVPKREPGDGLRSVILEK